MNRPLEFSKDQIILLNHLLEEMVILRRQFDELEDARHGGRTPISAGEENVVDTIGKTSFQQKDVAERLTHLLENIQMTMEQFQLSMTPLQTGLLNHLDITSGDSRMHGATQQPLQSDEISRLKKVNRRSPPKQEEKDATRQRGFIILQSIVNGVKRHIGG